MLENNHEDMSILSDDAFRMKFRDWLEATYPDEWKNPVVFRLHGAEETRWLRMLCDGGFRCPSWPRKYGGMGLGLRKQLIYHEELERIGAARNVDTGATLLGATIIRHGTDAQKQKYLPEVLNGDCLWCQGFSEPNAGSDLASLKTTAVLDGDEYVINGTKIWTTMAPFSHKIFLLARTDMNAPRPQQGISMLIVDDMKQEGMTVSSITNLNGEAEFAQVFFDDVRIPATNVIYEVNKGWDVAKAMLGDERIFIGSPTLANQTFAVLEELISKMGKDTDTIFKAEVAKAFCDLNDLRALFAQVCDAAIRGVADGKTYSTIKVQASETFKRISDTLINVAQEYGPSVGHPDLDGFEKDILAFFLIARPSTIYGGASEIQKTIIARDIFGPPAKR